MRKHASIRGRAVVLAVAIVSAAAFVPRSASAVNAVDYAVRASAVTQKNPPRITLTWTGDPDATSYSVQRKAKDATAWGSATGLSGSATSFVDNNVVVGGSYEYKIQKNANEGGSGYTGYGYVYAGIDAPLIDNRGRLLLLVDNTHAGTLATELNRLVQDMVGDGWTVIRRDVSRNDSVVNIKNLIVNDYNSGGLNAVFVFGHVPVPYSGLNNPDGHQEHKGAWPCDAFYGEMNGTWTDSTVNHTSSARPENRNSPGDGKYDQSTIPSDLELAVGRVDLYNMPAFGISETELLRRYLNKDHSFRIGQMSVQRRGLVDDHFGVHSSGGAFAQNGWRNFAAFFGANNTYQLDWFTTLPTNTYLWAYATGGGTYTSAWGIGSTQDFAALDPKVVFTMVFGSYFYDWDNQNNFMRAPLCTTTMGLSSSWGCWPHHFYHHMALGETLGYGIKLSINNNGLYPTSKARGSYVALMGDPTLRMHPVKPASNLNASGSSSVSLTWNASPDSNIVGYHVYRATNANGPYTRLTGSVVTTTAFTDNTASQTTYTYMVRAVKLESASSGTYFNPSQGIFKTYTPGGGPPPPDEHDMIVVEAEQFSSKIDRSSHVWTLVTSPGGYSANGAMRASPNTGTQIETNYASTSPVLNYGLTFERTGTYYLWVRGSGASGGDDSIHAGLDNAAQSTANNISNFPASWTWSRSTMDGANATINVPSTGSHVFNLWMREDGFVADKIILTSDPDFVPSGIGPPANQGGGGGGNQAPVILSEPFANPNPTIVGRTTAFAVVATDPDGDPLTYNWNFGDGTNGSGATPTHAYSTTGTFNVSVTVSDGHGGTDNDSFSVVVQAFKQDSAGLVSLEAEHYHNKVAQGGRDWVSTYVSGQSSGALIATPDAGAQVDSSYATSSPRLDFRVKFNRTGTHYVWVRGLGGSGSNDSCHVGMDGVCPGTCNKMSNFNSSWKWSKSTMDGPVATINITSTGVHTINLWMREDGFRADKIVITSSSSYTPSGTGPAESVLGE